MSSGRRKSIISEFWGFRPRKLTGHWTGAREVYKGKDFNNKLCKNEIKEMD